MKKTKILYWVFTGLLAVLFTFTSIPDIMVVSDAVALVSGHLGYPEYIIRFLGVAKLLAVIAIVVPGFPRLKEWAYAGLVFDLTGAMYSGLSVGDPLVNWLPVIIIGFPLIFTSYIFHHRLQSEKAKFKSQNGVAGDFKVAVA